MEICPKCGTRFIQFSNITDECYCLVKKCNFRWFMHLIRNKIENIYLRTSMYVERV